MTTLNPEQGQRCRDECLRSPHVDKGDVAVYSNWRRFII